MATDQSQKSIDDGPVSLSAYARHRGISRQAVNQGVKAGRLIASIEHDSRGRPRIKSIALADQEWDASGVATKSEPTDALAAQGIPSLAVSRARLHAAKASIATMELLEKKKKLIAVEKVRAEIADRFSHLRTRLLAIPSEARTLIPELTDVGAAKLDKIVRDALEQLAEEIG